MPMILKLAKKKLLFSFLIAFFTSPIFGNIITVDTSTDVVDAADGVMSLREAINLANTTAGLDTIQFDPATDGNTITLTLVAANEDANAGGDLDVIDAAGIVIMGNGMTQTILDGNNTERILHIIDGALTLSGVTIQNGNETSSSGGLLIAGATGNVNIDQSTFTNNMGSNGAGLSITRDNGSNQITNTSFTNNTATDSGGGIRISGGNATLIIDNCNFTGNTVNTFNGAGLDFASTDGFLTLINSTFSNNMAGGSRGGAIRMNNGDVLLIDNCIITNNQIGERGGGIGMTASNCQLTIRNSTITGNTAGTNGGGIYVSASNSTSNIINCTISGNRANGHGGGINVNASDFSPTTLNLDFVTITQNIADDNNNNTDSDGGGIAVTSSLSRLNIRNSIIQGNDDESTPTADDCANPGGGTITSQGGNVFGNNTGCTVTGSDTSGDAMLAALGDNGGTNQTHALQVGSAAINFGTCDTITHDQRNFARSDGMCDAGAYEFAGTFVCPNEENMDFTSDGTFTVPNSVTQVTIVAKGAQGGAAGPLTTGGNGATVIGTYSVTPGDVLNVFLGQQGETTGVADFGTGGGGGTAVTNATSSTLLVVAGGGSGAGSSNTDGVAASGPIIMNNGASGTAGTTSGNAGGGGAFENSATGSLGGGQGTIGSNGTAGMNTGGLGGGGGAGGDGGAGFGGGGGTDVATGGGGGGYNGGNPGVGGSSFSHNSRTVGTPTLISGDNIGNGSVQVCWSVCTIDVSIANISSCTFSGDGTVSSGTSYFTADITVTFANNPTTGSIVLLGDAAGASVNLGTLPSGITSHTFVGVLMLADGGPIEITANFNNSPTCSITKTLGTAPAGCAPCGQGPITIDNTGSVGLYTSLAVINGNPAISYHRGTGSVGLNYVRATNTSGTSWGTPVLVDMTGTLDGYYTSLTTVDGFPAIAYADDANRDLKFVRATDADGTAWGAPIILDTDFGIRPEQIAFLIVNGNPAIAYHGNSNGLRYIRATNPQGTAWAAPVVIVSSTNSGTYPTMTIVNGNPAIAYYENSSGTLRYVRALDANGATWGTPQALDGALSSPVGWYASLDIVNGTPAISYYDATNSGLKYIRATDANGTTWGTSLTLDNNGATGLYSSLEVVDGLPAISYYEGTGLGDILKYIQATDANGTAWNTPIISDIGKDIGFNTSLKVVDGNAAISYYDNGNTALKYVLIEACCSITAINTTNPSSCTFAGGNSTFTADVTVTFSNPPNTGTLNLTGDGTASVDVSNLTSATTHTFTGVALPADGGAIDLTATFSGNTTCTFNQPNTGTAPDNCQSDVVTTPPIPTMSQWGLVIFGLLVLNLGLLCLFQLKKE